MQEKLIRCHEPTFPIIIGTVMKLFINLKIDSESLQNSLSLAEIPAIGQNDSANIPKNGTYGTVHLASGLS